MIARSRLVFDEALLNMQYSDWLKYRSKIRKFAPYINLVILLCGVYVLVATQMHVSGIGVILLSVYVLIESLTYRKRWIKTQMKHLGGKIAEVEFYADELHHRSAASEGKIALSAFTSKVAGDHGFFLTLPNKYGYYFPWSSLDSADAAEKLRVHLFP